MFGCISQVWPAILAGCCVILKPSEVAPLDANILAEILHEIGLPAGVFNLVHGRGLPVGEPMCVHPKVDMVSFTGSTNAGKRVGQLAAQNIKKCKLELGGKSAHIVLDDADIGKTVGKSLFGGVFINSGQTCSALTRLLVPRQHQEAAAQAAKKAAEKVRVGPGTDPKAQMGPLSSKKQLNTVRSYIQKGIDEGATLVTGGTAAPSGMDTGFFVQPTVFKDVNRGMTIANEEIFGPVLCIIPYDSEQEAIDIANDSIYGLSGAVSSGDAHRAAKYVGWFPPAVHAHLRAPRCALAALPFALSVPARLLGRQPQPQRPRRQQLRSWTPRQPSSAVLVLCAQLTPTRTCLACALPAPCRHRWSTASRARSARASCLSTVGATTCARPSVGTSSRASGAKRASTASTSSCRLNR